MSFEYLSPDTSREAARRQIAVLRGLGISGRAEMAFDLSDGLRATVEAGIRHRHPEYSDDEVRLALQRLTLGEELFQEVHPGVGIRP